MKMNKNALIKCLALLFMVVSLLSCREQTVVIDSIEKEMFLETQDEGLYKGGREILVYDGHIHQKAYNPARRTYRIQTDNQAKYFNVVFESVPKSRGVHILTEFSYVSEEENITSKLLLECSMIDKNKIWFWDSEDKIGIIVSFE